MPINNTISQIETRLRENSTMPDAKREELLALLDTLDGEVAKLSKTKSEQAESIARFAELSTHEAIRKERDPQLLDAALQGFEKSVRDIEASHPDLACITNSLCVMLANLGI